MRSTIGCSFSRLMLVLSFWGCLCLGLVSGQPATNASDTRIVSTRQGLVDIGGDCVVNEPCDPRINFGLYAHRTNCSEYFQCEASKRITGYSCPSDTRWNKAISQCDYADQAECQQGCPLGSTPLSNISTTAVASEVYEISNNCEVSLPCDPNDNQTAGRYANPDDCQEYFVCQANGNLLRVYCPVNQYYDYASKRCLDRGRVECHGHEQCPPGSRMKQNKTMSSTTTTTTMTTSVPEEFTGPCNPPEVCTPGDKRYHPGPGFGFCGYYFECTDSNEWMKRKCPGRGLFLASKGECTSSGVISFGSGDCPTGCPSTPINQVDQVTTETVSSVVNIGMNCQVELPCHAQIRPVYRYIPHPDNCSLYWFCNSTTGNLTLKECPANTFLNSSTRNCEPIKENSEGYCQCGCPDGSDTIQITSTTVTATPTTTMEASPPLAPRDDVVCNRPKTCNTNFDRVRLADPENCGKYYVCFHGRYGNWSCPSEYNFDAVTEECLSKSEANCHPPCTIPVISSSTTTESTTSTKCATITSVVSLNETTTMHLSSLSSSTSVTTTTTAIPLENTTSNSPSPPFTTTTEAQVVPPPPPPPPPTLPTATTDNASTTTSPMPTTTTTSKPSTTTAAATVTDPSEDIYCEPETVEGISWQRTQAGNKDRKPCPDERKGSATRECGYSSSRGVGLWTAPNFELCADPVYTELVLDLESKISDPMTVTPMVYRNLTMQLEKLTMKGTEQPDGMSPGNLDATVDALTLLVNLSTSQGQVLTMENAHSLVETASTLLSANNMDSWNSVLEEDEDKAVLLMSTLDQFGHQVATMVPPGESQTIKTANIVIQAKSVSTDTDTPVIFGAERPKLKSVSDKGDNGLRQGIILETETIENIAKVVPGDHLLIWSSHYKTLNDLLPKSDNEVINSDVISLTIDGLPEGTKFEPEIQITFAMQNSSMKDYKVTCSFWKYHSSASGEWSSKGVTTVSYNKSGVHCECNHLTNFAVLISPYVAEGIHGDILTLITTIGCLLSIVGCTITICLYCLCWKRVKSHHAAVLLNLCFILILGNVLFLVGIDRTEPEILCTVIAVGLHYIWLAAFFIMLADGIEFILYVVYVFHVKRRTETFLLLFTAYIVPAVIVGISASVTKLKGYGDEKACWLSWSNGLIFAFIIPAVVIMLVNFCILIKILCTAGNSEGAKQSDRSRVRATIWNIAVILPLLGISWIFGIFSLDENTLAFQYLFAICSSLQGFAIFIFHCILNKKLRDAVGQRFSSGWSSAGSYKSSKSVKSNRSDKLVKKIIKRDKARNGAINKGYLTNGSQDNGRDQVYMAYDGHMEPESPTPETKLQHSYDDLHHRNSAVRYQNGGLRHSNGSAQHLYQKNPSTPQITPRLPHKSIVQKTPEEASVSSMEYQFHIADNASTYMVVEPEYLDPNDLGCYNDPVYPSSKPNFRSSGIVILGYDESDLSQESGSI